MHLKERKASRLHYGFNNPKAIYSKKSRKPNTP
jgi:hypothetical protein